jgi:hypothetical protein
VTPRRDKLTAQKIDVALVFQQMLSTREARAYLIENKVCPAIIARVLDPARVARRAKCSFDAKSAYECPTDLSTADEGRAPTEIL